MYKKNMNNIPIDVHSTICMLLGKDYDRDLVHCSFGSMPENDRSIYTAVARDNRAQDEKGYSVFCYDPEVGDLYREKSGLTYADALIEMGERIKE